MENNFKRFLSLMLALIMVVGMMPMGHVHAEEEATTVKVAATDPCSDLGLEVGQSAEFIIVGGKAQGRSLGVLNDSNNGQHVTSQDGNKTGIELLNVAVSSINSVDHPNAFWIITKVDESNYTLECQNGTYVQVKNNNYAELVADGTIQIRRSTNGDYADYWEILNDGPHYLNYFDSFGNATSTGWAASSWQANGPGSQWEIYKVVEKTMDELDPWGKRNWVTDSVDSETLNQGKEGEFWKAFDSNSGTHWHSDWQSSTDKVTNDAGTAGNMETISGVIDFGQVYNINQFSFTPRVDQNSGRVTKASLLVKENEGDEWTTVAEHVTFAANGDKKTFCFNAQNVQYVKFVAEQSSDGWVAVSEFDINYDENHTFSSVETPATCGADGYTTHSCSCGYSYTTPGAPATGEHTPGAAATCTTAQTCTECGAEITPALGHTEVVDEAVAPTCTETGLTEGKHCSVCGVVTVAQEEVSALGHTAGEPVVENEVPATCTAEGSYDSVVKCSVCGEEMSRETITTDKLSHPDEDGNSFCDICGEPLCTEHVEETIPGYAATCTESGLTDGKKCSVCGEIITAQEEIPALGHTPGEPVIENNVAPTLDTTGSYDSVTYCSVCNTELTRVTTTVPALDYNEGIIPVADLTATAGDWETDGGDSEGPANLVLDGNFNTKWHTDWYGTSRDNHWIQFQISGDYTVSGLRYKPRMDGSNNGNITGYIIQVSNDGQNFRTVTSGTWENNKNWKVAEFDAIQVKYVRLVATNAYSDNSYVFASASEIRLVGVLNDGDHVHVYESVVTAPTCTEDGYTTYTCACGYTYTDNEVAALGHSYDDGVVTTEPTCDEAGVKTFTCSVCGHTYTEEIPATGEHTYEAVVTAPTCTEGGYTTYTCSVCGDSYVADETEALGHTPGAAAEETIDGVKYMVVRCTVCGAEISRTPVVVEEPKVVVREMNVLLESEIKMAYTVEIPAELAEGAKIVLTKGTETVTYENLVANEDGYYVVEMGVASAEMTTPIGIQVFDADDNALELFNKSGESQTTSAARTVVDFARSVLNNEESSAQKIALVKAMLVYGGYAQEFFGVDAENPAYGKLEGIDASLDAVTEDMFESYKNGQTNKEMGVTAKTITAFLDSAIYVRVYLAVEGDIANYTFTLTTPEDVKQIEAGYENGRYYVDITDIASAYIDYQYTITVTNTEGETNVITTSVLSYGRSVLNNSNNTQEKKDLIKALYLYNQAANGFWTER